MQRENLLMVADSEQDADMLYAVGVFVPDPFIFLRVKGKAHIVMSDLEYDRARAQAPHCRVLSLSNCREKVQAQGVKRPQLAHIIRHLLRSRGLKRIFVPAAFPLGLAQDLRRLKIKVRVLPGDCFPEREIKSAAEVKRSARP